MECSDTPLPPKKILVCGDILPPISKALLYGNSGVILIDQNGNKVGIDNGNPELDPIPISLFYAVKQFNTVYSPRYPKPGRFRKGKKAFKASYKPEGIPKWVWCRSTAQLAKAMRYYRHLKKNGLLPLHQL